MSDFIHLADGLVVAPPARWEVGARGDQLVVRFGPLELVLEHGQRDRFAEAVARAVTPGQVTT